MVLMRAELAGVGSSEGSTEGVCRWRCFAGVACCLAGEAGWGTSKMDSRSEDSGTRSFAVAPVGGLRERVGSLEPNMSSAESGSGEEESVVFRKGAGAIG